MNLISYVVKVLLVEALLVYLSPGHWEKKWSIPKARDSTENICRQVFPVEPGRGILPPPLVTCPKTGSIFVLLQYNSPSLEDRRWEPPKLYYRSERIVTRILVELIKIGR